MALAFSISPILQPFAVTIDPRSLFGGYPGTTPRVSLKSTPVFNLQAFKWIFYLDPVTADTGCLRMIPASHLLMGAEREA